LADRVSFSISKNFIDYIDYYDMISKQLFIPAGNTLLAGVDKIRPNCAVFHLLTKIIQMK
jgi:hypothetical protein